MSLKEDECRIIVKRSIRTSLRKLADSEGLSYGKMINSLIKKHDSDRQTVKCTDCSFQHSITFNKENSILIKNKPHNCEYTQIERIIKIAPLD